MRRNILRTLWMACLFGSISAVNIQANEGGHLCCSSQGIDIEADFLYWKVCQSDLTIGISDTNRLTGPGRISSGDVRFLNFNYEPGFRIHLGYQVPCTCWQLDAAYTHFHFKTHETVTPSLGGAVWTTNMAPWISSIFLIGRANEAFAEYKLKYDLVDLLVSTSQRCGCFTGRPYGGIRLFFFDNQFGVDYLVDDPTTPALVRLGTTDWDVYMPSGGVTIGYEGKYAIDCGCGLLARLGGSFLGAHVHHHQTYTFPSTSATDSPIFQSDVEAKHCQFIWGWDAALGLTYDLDCDCCPISVAVGYEIQDWWNMPRQRMFSGETPGVSTTDEGGRFTVHGLFVRAGVTF